MYADAGQTEPVEAGSNKKSLEEKKYTDFDVEMRVKQELEKHYVQNAERAERDARAARIAKTERNVRVITEGLRYLVQCLDEKNANSALT
jgi:hypothetical protein